MSKKPKVQLYEISALLTYHVVLLAVSDKDAKEHVETWEQAWHSSADLIDVSDVEVFDVRPLTASDWRDEAHEMTISARASHAPEDYSGGIAQENHCENERVIALAKQVKALLGNYALRPGNSFIEQAIAACDAALKLRITMRITTGNQKV